MELAIKLRDLAIHLQILMRILNKFPKLSKIYYIWILKVQELFGNYKLWISKFHIKIIVLVTLNTRGVSGGHHFGYTKLGKERSALFTFFWQQK